MIEIKNVSKKFKSGESEFFALKNVSFTIPDKGITVISGPSGSGKSTLLSIIGLLQTPTEGEISFDGKNTDYRNGAAVRQYIRENISYVFQEFNLVDDFSVEDNLLMVCFDRFLVSAILEKVGLSAKKQTPTRLLSGGEKQRLAIGRAIAKDGDIVLLDEPTGNLDAENGRMVFELLKGFSKTKTIVVVTHDLKLAYNYADFVVLLNSGKIVSEFRLNSGRYTLDPKDGRFDSYSPLIEVLKYKTADGPVDIRVTGGSKEEKLTLDAKNILSSCQKIYADNPDRTVTVEILTQGKKEDSADLPFTKGTENRIFPAKYIFRYSRILFKNKLWKNIFSIFLLVLNIVMIFTYSCFASFDYTSATRAGFNNNDAYFTAPYQLERNNVNGQISRYFSGENLYDHLSGNGIEAHPRIEVTTDLNHLIANLVILDGPISFRDSLVEVPDTDCAVVTDFMKEVARRIEEEKKVKKQHKTDTSGDIGSRKSSDGEWKTVSVTGQGGVSFTDYPLTVSGTVESHWTPDDVSAFMNNLNIQIEDKDLFLNEFALIFVSEETYMNMMRSSSQFLYAANFLGSKLPTNLYAKRETQYGVYEGQTLCEGGGTKPSDEFDVVISSSYLKANEYFTGYEEISDCLNQEVRYKDLSQSPNRDLYQAVLNLPDITPKVKIVGVTDDSSCDVYVTQEFMDAILVREKMYLSGFLIDTSLPDAALRSVISDDVFFDFAYLSPVLQLMNLIKSDFMSVILVAICIMLLSTVTFLCLTFVSNVRTKYKEIAILKSFGTKKRNIYALFFILNYAIAFLSIVLGLAFSALALNFINAVLKSPTVFNINYSILTATPVSFVVVIAVTLLAALISTFIALRRVSKIDVALALKMF